MGMIQNFNCCEGKNRKQSNQSQKSKLKNGNQVNQDLNKSLRRSKVDRKNAIRKSIQLNKGNSLQYQQNKKINELNSNNKLEQTINISLIQESLQQVSEEFFSEKDSIEMSSKQEINNSQMSIKNNENQEQINNENQYLQVEDSELALNAEFWENDYEKELSEIKLLNEAKLHEISYIFQQSVSKLPPKIQKEQLDIILLEVDCITEKEQRIKHALILSTVAVYLVNQTDYTTIQYRIAYNDIDIIFYNPIHSLLLIKPIKRVLEEDDYKGIFIENSLNFYIISAIGNNYFSLLNKNIELEILMSYEHIYRQFINENMEQYRKDREKAQFDLFKEVSTKFGDKSKTESLLEVIDIHFLQLSNPKMKNQNFDDQEENAKKIQATLILSSMNIYLINSEIFEIYGKIPLQNITQIITVKGAYNQFMLLSEKIQQTQLIFHLNTPDFLRKLQGAFKNIDHKVKFKYLAKLLQIELEFQNIMLGNENLLKKKTIQIKQEITNNLIINQQ